MNILLPLMTYVGGISAAPCSMSVIVYLFKISKSIKFADWISNFERN